MGGKKSESPDYRGAAEESGESSKYNTQYQTHANRPNMNTPWGTSEWRQESFTDPVSGKVMPRWTNDLTLSPTEKKAFDDQQAIKGGRSEIAKGLLGNANQDMQTPDNFWNNLPDVAGTPDVPDYYGKDLPSAGQFPNPNQQAGESFDLQGKYQGLNDWSQAPESAYNPEFAQTAYDRQMSLAQPGMDQGREALEARLRNQGLQPGTRAYDNQMKELTTGQSEQQGRWQQDAMKLGADEQQRQWGRDLQGAQYGDSQRGQQFGELDRMNQIVGGQADSRFQRELASANFQNQSRNQAMNEQLQYGNQGFGQQMQQQQQQNVLRQNAIAEQMQREGWSLNKINAMLSGQQVGMPSFQGQPNSTATKSDTIDYLGAAQSQGDWDMAANQNSADMWGNVAGGASSLAMMSDANLKKDIVKLGEVGGLDLVKWTWNGLLGLTGESMGYIAQQVKTLYPQYVITTPLGYLAIDYAGLEEALNGNA